MYPDPPLLVHLCRSGDWRTARAAGQLAAESLREGGFIHLSTAEQAHLPANRLFAGRRDLLAVYIDPARLPSAPRWEPGVADDPPSMRFPHLYAPLPLTAVVGVRRYRPGSDGRFPPLPHRPVRGCRGGQDA